MKADIFGFWKENNVHNGWDTIGRKEKGKITLLCYPTIDRTIQKL